MPWQETCAMEERMRFVLAARAGEETMAALCRRFGIRPKTGYKWLHRYEAEGPAGLVDRSRAPHSHPQAVPEPVREALFALRRAHPDWGPKKLAVRLPQLHPDLVAPAPSTIGDLLKTAGYTVPRRRRRHVPPRTEPLAHATGPNAVWCADFKGDFRLGDGARCYPFTLCDAASRMLLRCQALVSTTTERVEPLFDAAFREFGLPDVLRTDNGPPFASTGIAGLTAMSVRWVRLGIRPERIDPGKPVQNGRLERLHGTLKRAVCAPPASSLRQQQQRFDRFRDSYNEDRPHEALGQVPPASRYEPSARVFPERLPEPEYPDADGVRRVRPNGSIRWRRDEVYLGQVLTGELIALSEVADGVWSVAFGPLLLGTFAAGQSRLVPPRRP